MAGTSGSETETILVEEDDSGDEFIPGYKDMSSFTQAGFQTIMAAIKTSNSLPSTGDDFDYYSSFDSFRSLMDVESARILQIIQKMMRYHGARGNITTSSELVDLEEKFDVLVDANDQLLERVGNNLDEASGVRKKETSLVLATVSPKVAISGSWNKKTPQSKGVSLKSNYRLLSAKNIQRPQLKFKDKIDNSSRPFVPIITEKPNALKPLSESLQTDEIYKEDDIIPLPHPYLYELEQWKPLPSQLEKGSILEPKPLSESPSRYVDSEAGLHDVVKILSQEEVIAVDLEHHSYRSYQGITCLMQISTRTQDFIIDALLLRSQMPLLNQVFTNPNIVKVFHGADLDIEWLQRDLGLYVVNMFDTGQASRVLNLQRFSLQYLLSTYCNVQADKQFQLADWRIRPLPEELINYAQEDTHYLLYIYDRLRVELIERGNDQNNLLLSVLQRSKTLCQKTYKKFVLSEDSYLELYKRTKKVFNSQQLDALKSLYSWRDSIGRIEDESLGYVLPNHMLMQICEVLPREPQGVLACCNPIPPLVRQNLAEIHLLIKAAREKPLEKETKVLKVLKPTREEHPMFSASGLLSCPHDLSHQDIPVEGCVEINVSKAQKSSFFKSSPDIHICDVKIKKSSKLFGSAAKLKAQKINKKLLKKVAEIESQFNNPLDKFLPEDILQKMPLLEQTSDKEVAKWKLLPHTFRHAPAKTVGPVMPEMTVPMADVILVTADEPEESKSIREQYPKGNKRPAEEGEETKSEVVAKKVHEVEEFLAKAKEESKQKLGKKKKDFLAPFTDFKAYDYSQSDYNMFDKSNESSHGKSYNPEQGALVGKHKGGFRKRKSGSGSGKKSMTYTQGKPSSSKIQWPKR